MKKKSIFDLTRAKLAAEHYRNRTERLLRACRSLHKRWQEERHRADVVLRLVDDVREMLARDTNALAEELYTITTECDREVAIRRMAARLLPEEKP